MNTLETLNKRKSVRTYTEEPVSDNDLTTILECAWCSPVGMKQYDSLRLTVIKNQELLESIEENARTFMHKEDYKPLYGAKTLIIVSSNQVLENQNVAYSNCAIVAHNMALGAVELNLGSCYIWGAIIALAQNKSLVAKLNLEEGFIPCCGIILGHTTEKYTPRILPKNRIQTNVID